MTTVFPSFNDAFAPLPEYPQPRQHRRDFLDHLGTYASTTFGAWDTFRTIDHLLSPLKFLSLAEPYHQLINKVTGVIGSAGSALSLPVLISDAASVRNSVRSIWEMHALPSTAPDRNQRVMQSHKRFIVSSMYLGNNCSQAALFFDETKLFSLGRYFPFANGAYQVTSLVTDTADLLDESYKLRHYSLLAQPGEVRERDILCAKKNLSWLKIAKDIPSIAYAVLTLVGMAFASVNSLPFMPILLFGLSLVWLSMKVTCYFYDKMVLAELQNPL